MSQMIQASNHPYITIKLKIVVDEYIAKCTMLNKRGMATDVFKTKKENLVPVILNNFHKQ